MPSVSVEELQQRTRQLLRRVKAGETFEITREERPVARLSPVRELYSSHRRDER